MAPLHARHQLLQGAAQTQLGDNGRPELAEDFLDMLLHMLGRCPNGIGPFDDFACRGWVTTDLVAISRIGRSIDIDGKQKGAHLVMQVAGEAGALLVLHGLQLLAQPGGAQLHVAKRSPWH